MTNEEKMLPCPFCGGSAKLRKGANDDGDENVCVECSLCAVFSPPYDVELQNLTIRDWNTRAPIMTESELEKQDKLIAEIEGLKQSAEGSQMVEVCIQVDAYNNAINDVVKIIRKYGAASNEIQQQKPSIYKERLRIRYDSETGLPEDEIDRLNFEIEMLQIDKKKLKAENEQLRGEIESARLALTPSFVTKAALIGEFSFFEERFDENGEGYSHKCTVPWKTTKEIMQAISKLAFDSQPTPSPSGEEGMTEEEIIKFVSSNTKGFNDFDIQTIVSVLKASGALRVKS